MKHLQFQHFSKNVQKYFKKAGTEQYKAVGFTIDLLGAYCFYNVLGENFMNNQSGLLVLDIFFAHLQSQSSVISLYWKLHGKGPLTEAIVFNFFAT